MELVSYLLFRFEKRKDPCTSAINIPGNSHDVIGSAPELYFCR